MSTDSGLVAHHGCDCCGCATVVVVVVLVVRAVKAVNSCDDVRRVASTIQPFVPGIEPSRKHGVGMSL